jgi:Asp-tRNA(Asn)/Glu-tRNA(Gln) amidotransferase A subunit family amidase
MSESPLAAYVFERLRNNLRGANIPFNEEDMKGIVEKGFLKRINDFEELVASNTSDTIPDFLGPWGEQFEQEDLDAKDGEKAEERPQLGLIANIAGLIQSRQLSPRDLVEQTLAKIAERDPELNAFQLVLAEQARAAAQRAETEIAAGVYRGPLHGVPIAIKDLVDYKGVPTTAGSKIFAGKVAESNANAVDRLEAAGAIIIGKTRMSEFAYSPGSNNAHYGSTRNPWNLKHDTGGSSSGSGAAIASGLVLGALGSDTGGSIRMPAAQCGIVGLKPTYGLVSLAGCFPLSWTLDHLGPMTRSVADAALMLNVLAGYDPNDIRTRKLPQIDYTANLEQGVKGLRIGLVEEDGSADFGGTISEARQIWQRGLAALERAGAEIVPIKMPQIDPLRVLNSAILAMEASALHEPYLRTNLDDYGEFMRQRVLAAFAYSAQSYMRAQQARNILRQQCNALFAQVDLISTPTIPFGAPPLGVPTTTNFTAPFNALGWPTITVPVAVGAGNLPHGIQLAGRPWDDATVLRAAYALEREIGWVGLV